MNDKGLFYVQRHASGYVGNCLLFWKNDNHGYTYDLDSARIFMRDEMEELVKGDRGQKYTAWPKEYLDSVSIRHVDCQHLARRTPEEAVAVLERELMKSINGTRKESTNDNR